MPKPRRVVRRPAKPSHTVRDRAPGLKGLGQRILWSLEAFFLSFTGRQRFKSYWLSRAGFYRILKGVGVLILLIVAVFAWYAKDLPSPGKVNAKIGSTTTFYARDAIDSNGNLDLAHGTKLYEVHGAQNRLVIPLSEMPAVVKQATIAVEDRNFYKHGAFSFLGIFRAALEDIIHRGTYQGGSTITQQYVKNALLDPSQHSFSRKIKELILSVEIGQFYSKDQILGLYLNEIPYGNTSYGIEAACRTYFSDKYGTNHCAKNLNLGEAAMLAAALNAPSYYSPYGQHQDQLIERQHLVLDLMASQGYITKQQATDAKWTTAQVTADSPTRDINQFPSFYSAITAPNFVLTLQDQLEAKYGTSAIEEGGWNVVTTLDPNLQKCAELSIYNPGNDTCNPTGKAGGDMNPNVKNKNYKNLQALGGSNAALVAANPDNGQILAMVGSYSFSATQLNLATTPRQPGSSFKPYVYATLFSKNKSGCTGSGAACTTYGAGSVLDDTTTNFGTDGSPYTPQDFGGGAHVNGPVTIRSALDGSLNIPAVHALQLAGVSQSIATAHSLGITTLNNDPSSYGLSLVLGSGEVSLADHVNGYESFANGGVHYAQSMVLKIVDDKNKTVEDDTKPPTPKKVLDPQVAYLIANILSDGDARRYVFGSDLDIPGKIGHSEQGMGVAAKTGTTEHYNDGWTMGFTPSLVAGVWAGNNDNTPMSREAADIAAPIWRSFMTAALSSKPIETFTKPAGLQFLPNSAPAKQQSASSDYFPAWYKGVPRKNIKIDSISGKLATNCTPPLAVQEVPDTGVTDSDDVHSCSDIQPAVNLTVTPSGGGAYEASATVTLGTFGTTKSGPNPAKLDIYFDDQIISTQSISASGTYNVPYTPDASATGSHAFKAVVTDSGLYQANDAQTVTVGSTGSTFSGIAPAAGSTYPNNTPITFVWQADPGAASYDLWIDGTKRQGGITMTTTNFTVHTAGPHTWHVVANNGDASADISFTTQ